MTIQLASDRSGISKDMIRYYEKIGLIQPGRRENGYRDYSEDDLNTLVLIRMLSNSRIPLRRIREAFQNGNVGILQDGVEAELRHLRRLRLELEVRERALQIDLDCFRQHSEGGGLRRVHYPSRWYVWKKGPGSFTKELRDICGEDQYFHYTADLTASVRDGKAGIKPGRQGIILYSPHPDAKMIAEQDCLRVILTHPAGMMLGEKELAPIVEEAFRQCPRQSYQLLCYQIFHTMETREACVVCVEILLGSD